MSLSDRLKNAERRRPNRGCETCLWFAELPKKDQKAFDEWVVSGWSVRQLYLLCASDPINALKVSQSALRNHIHDCMGMK